MTGQRLNVLSARTQPLNGLITLKVGSTFVRNLIYTLDHGAPFSDVEKAFPTDLLTRDLTREALAEEVSFFVVRDPVERLFSLYFDKVIGLPENRFKFVTKVLTENRIFHDGPALTITQHRENIMSLIGYIDVRIKGIAAGPVNPHWNKQYTRVEPAIRFGLKAIMLDRFEAQLLQIAGGRITGLKAAFAKVTSRNRSRHIVEISEVLTPEIYDKISAVYAEDIQLYDLVKTGWEVLGHPPEINL